MFDQRDVIQMRQLQPQLDCDVMPIRVINDEV